MGLFGNKREKCDKVEKYEQHSSTKGNRAGYGPPALSGGVPSSSHYGGAGGSYFDGYGQLSPQGKLNKYDKYPLQGKNYYGGDPMQQAMLLPPQSPVALQAQQAAMIQMQQYMQGPGANAQFGGILPPIQMPLATAQQVGLLPSQPQSQPFYAFPQQQQQQQSPNPFFDGNNGAFQGQQGSFAPYQQGNIYDPSAVGGFPAPYGYMPSAF